MKLSIAFPVLALSLALVGCDDHRPDWVDADAAQEVEDTSVPQLVDKASPPAVSKATPVADDTTKAATVDASKETKKTVVDPIEDDEPEIDVEAKLFVKRLVVAQGVDNREPVSPSSTFSKGEADKIYAFIEVGNEDKSPSAITVSFFRDGKPERGGVELRVGASPRWRTWAFTRQATEPGIWHVVVRGPKGQELAREKFEIVGDGTAPQAKAEPKTEPATKAAEKAVEKADGHETDDARG